MLTPWNSGFSEWDRPFAVLDDLRHEMERVLRDFEHGAGPTGARARMAMNRTWPYISLRDDGPALRLRAEVPGLSEKDVAITVEQGSVTLRGERKPDVPEGYAVHRQERPAVAFARSFTLPSRIDTEKVVAHLKDGVLEMTLPKAAEAQPRQIQVRTS